MESLIALSLQDHPSNPNLLGVSYTEKIMQWRKKYDLNSAAWGVYQQCEIY